MSMLANEHVTKAIIIKKLTAHWLHVCIPNCIVLKTMHINKRLHRAKWLMISLGLSQDSRPPEPSHPSSPSSRWYWAFWLQDVSFRAEKKASASLTAAGERERSMVRTHDWWCTARVGPDRQKRTRWWSMEHRAWVHLLYWVLFELNRFIVGGGHRLYYFIISRTDAADESATTWFLSSLWSLGLMQIVLPFFLHIVETDAVPSFTQKQNWQFP